LNLKTLQTIQGWALKSFLEIPDNAKFDGDSRSLNDRERVCLAYYDAIMTFLSSNGYGGPLETNIINKIVLEDSEVFEEDYL
jgi:hypothetical protein